MKAKGWTLQRDTEAYHRRKAAGVRGGRMRRGKIWDKHLAIAAGADLVPNRADGRDAGRYVGAIWSQRHRPARPSDVITRALRVQQEAENA